MIARDIAAESYFYFLEVPGKIYEIGTFNVYYNVDKDKIITGFTYLKTLYALITIITNIKNSYIYQHSFYISIFVIYRIANLLMVRKDFICTVHALSNGRYGMSGNTYIEERGRMIINTK